MVTLSSSFPRTRKDSNSSIDSIASSTVSEGFTPLFNQESESVQVAPSTARNLPAQIPSGRHDRGKRSATFDPKSSKSGHPSNDQDRWSQRNSPTPSNFGVASTRKLPDGPCNNTGKHTKTGTNDVEMIRSRKRTRSERSPSPSSPPKPKSHFAKGFSAFTDRRKRLKRNPSTDLPVASSHALKAQAKDKGLHSRITNWAYSVRRFSQERKGTSEKLRARDDVKPLATFVRNLERNNTKSDERKGGSITMPPRTLQQVDEVHGKASDEADQPDIAPGVEEAAYQDSQEPMSQDSQPLSQMSVDSFYGVQEPMPPATQSVSGTSSNTLRYLQESKSQDTLNCPRDPTFQASLDTRESMSQEALPDSQESMSQDSQTLSQMSWDSFHGEQEPMPSDSQSLSRRSSQETVHGFQEPESFYTRRARLQETFDGPQSKSQLSLDTPQQSQELMSQDSQPTFSQMSLDTPQQSQEPMYQDSQHTSSSLDTPQQSQELMSQDSQPTSSQMSLETLQQSQEPMSQDSQHISSQMSIDASQQSQEPMSQDSQPTSSSLDTPQQSQELMSQDSQPTSSQMSVDASQQSQEPMAQDSQPTSSQMTLDTPQPSQEPMSQDSQQTLSQMSLDTPQQSQEPMPEDSQALSR